MIRKTKEEVLKYVAEVFSAFGRVPTRTEFEALVDPTIPFHEVRQTLGSWNKITSAVEAFIADAELVRQVEASAAEVTRVAEAARKAEEALAKAAEIKRKLEETNSEHNS